MSADTAAAPGTQPAVAQRSSEPLRVADPSGHAAPRAARWRSLVWCLVPALGLVELGGQLSVSHRAPSQAEWASLRPQLARMKQPADLVLVAPAWAGVNARYALGDELLPLKGLARPDESSFPRAIEVSALGEHSSAISSWPTLEVQQVGPFTLTLKQNPAPARVLFDFVDQLLPQHAEVFTIQAGTQVRDECPFNRASRVTSGGLGGPPTFPAARFQCSGAEWFFMGVTVIDDSFEYGPKRCIWAHPTPNGNIGVVYREVPLGTTIHGYAQLPWLNERLAHGAPITLTLRVGGQELGSFVHRDGEGWKGFEFPLGVFAGSKQDVEFLVTTPNADNRHFCFQADTR